MTVHNIRARAFKDGLEPSAVTGAVYDVTDAIQTVATPVVSPNGGSFTGSVGVTLSCATVGAQIRYTTDGSSPTAQSTLYSGPFALSATATVRAKGFLQGMNESAPGSAVFTITAPPDPDPVGTPEISPAAGSYVGSVGVSISTATVGADIYYTTNGQTPSATTTLYTGPFTLVASATVKAIAIKPATPDSAIASASYTVVPLQVATPTISPNGGSHEGSVLVTLACATEGATINYTIDGGSVFVYSAPFTLTSTATVRAQGIKAGYNVSPLAVAVFTITAPAAVAIPTISPNGGTFQVATEVTLACATAGATIYYTTNGTTPTTGSTEYVAPFTLSTGSVYNVQAFAVKTGLTDSTVAGALFNLAGSQVNEYVVPLSIDSTGVAEASEDLFNFLASVPSGTPTTPNHIIFQENGIYKAEWPLQIFEKKNWLIRGEGARLKASTTGAAAGPPPSSMNPGAQNYQFQWPRGRQHLHLIYCEGLSIRDFMVEGPKLPDEPYISAYEGQHAYEAAASVHLEFDNCGCYGVWGDGFGFRNQGGQGTHWCRDVHIHGGGSYQVMGRQGVVPNNIADLLIENVTFANIKRSWIDIEIAVSQYPGAGCLRLTIRNVGITGVNNTFFTNGAACHAIDDVLLEDITTDRILLGLAPYGGVAVPGFYNTLQDIDNYDTIQVEGALNSERNRFPAGIARRGSYTFRRCVNTSGSQFGGIVAPFRVEGAASITVEDCQQNIQAPGLPFVSAWEGANINVSGNTGTNITAQYATLPDPTVANGQLNWGYLAESFLYTDPVTLATSTRWRFTDPVTYVEQYFLDADDLPMPDDAPVLPPYF